MSLLNWSRSVLIAREAGISPGGVGQGLETFAGKQVKLFMSKRFLTTFDKLLMSLALNVKSVMLKCLHVLFLTVHKFG